MAPFETRLGEFHDGRERRKYLTPQEQRAFLLEAEKAFDQCATCVAC